MLCTSDNRSDVERQNEASERDDTWLHDGDGACVGGRRKRSK